jgi:hypothetical protein
MITAQSPLNTPPSTPAVAHLPPYAKLHSLECPSSLASAPESFITPRSALIDDSNSAVKVEIKG